VAVAAQVKLIEMVHYENPEDALAAVAERPVTD
jgi:hypothetical protein